LCIFRDFSWLNFRGLHRAMKHAASAPCSVGIVFSSTQRRAARRRASALGRPRPTGAARPPRERQVDVGTSRCAPAGPPRSSPTPASHHQHACSHCLGNDIGKPSGRHSAHDAGVQQHIGPEELLQPPPVPAAEEFHLLVQAQRAGAGLERQLQRPVATMRASNASPAAFSAA